MLLEHQMRAFITEVLVAAICRSPLDAYREFELAKRHGLIREGKPNIDTDGSTAVAIGRGDDVYTLAFEKNAFPIGIPGRRVFVLGSQLWWRGMIKDNILPLGLSEGAAQHLYRMAIIGDIFRVHDIAPHHLVWVVEPSHHAPHSNEELRAHFGPSVTVVEAMEFLLGRGRFAVGSS